MKMRMKVLIGIGVLIAILVIASCFGGNKDIGIAGLKWGMSEQDVKMKVRRPDSVNLFGEEGVLKIAIGNDGLNIVQFMRYPESQNLKEEYKEFLELYYDLKGQYGNATRKDLLNPDEPDKYLYEIIMNLGHVYYAVFDIPKGTARISFEMISGMDIPVAKIVYRRS